MLNEVDPAANRSTANGSTTVFAYTFAITLKTDIEVLVDAVVKVVDVDYTVDGLGNSGGGNVTFFAAPANNAIVTRLRKQPASQLSDYVPNEAFPSDRIEADLDKLAMQIQQIKEQARRGFFLPKSSALLDQGIAVPTVGAFARGKSGGGIDWATPTNAGALSSPVPVSDGGTGATNATDARTNLGITALGEIVDTAFRVIGNLDATKKLAFQVDGLTTLTTRVITIQDSDDTLVGRNTTDTLTNKTLTAPTLTTPALGTPASGVVTNLTGTAAGVTVGGVPNVITLGTPTATTSGTTVDITGIPAGIKRVTVMLSGVSTNGTSGFLLQIGDSGGVETAGYNSGAEQGVSSTASTAGFILTEPSTHGTADTYRGAVTLMLQNSSTNTWVSTGTVGATGTTRVHVSAGAKATSAVLDRIRLTNVNGVDVFDAGAINIAYE